MHETRLILLAASSAQAQMQQPAPGERADKPCAPPDPNAPLSDKLFSSKGVICPPDTNSMAKTLSPPDSDSRTPVIPPPENSK